MSQGNGFVDVLLTHEPHTTVVYRTALVTYEESFVNGEFVSRGWNGAGWVNRESTRFGPTWHPTPQSFWLEIDGQLLCSHWNWVGLRKEETEKGLHSVVTLEHQLRPVTVEVHMLLDGTEILTRWLEVTNTGDKPAALSAVMPWSGLLQVVRNWRDYNLGDTPLYSIGYMEDTRHLGEGQFQWHPLPNARYSVDGHYRRPRHRHPMVILRNEATGEHFIAQLAWSAGYTFEFDLDADCGTMDRSAYLAFRIGPDAPAPLRIIAPGETVKSPEVHMGLVFGGFDNTIHAMHDHIRRSVMLPQARGRGGWVESGIGPEEELTPEVIIAQLDIAAELGAEVFFIDASWYTPPFGNWYDTCGDWEVDRKRFPDGLAPIRERAHQKGMLFGLWMDAERIGRQSKVYAKHSDWLSTAYDGKKRLGGGMLDISRPEVAKWMEEQIAKVIEENEIEFFRLDYNVGHIGRGGYVERDGYVENAYWRYYENLYAIYERLRQRFPDVIFESCSSGGARTDLGMVRLFSHTWVTDWQFAPRSFAIGNGMTMALPPEYVDRLFGGQDGHALADLDFQMRLCLFGRPTLTFPLPHVVEPRPNTVQYERIRHAVRLYKEFIRPFIAESRIYHHTPVLDIPFAKGYGVLEMAAPDGSRAVAGIFRLSSPAPEAYTLYPRGLDAGKRYRLTRDNSGQSVIVDGLKLLNEGIRVRLEGALTSELLLFEAID